MRFPIDITIDGCAFALKCNYEHQVYIKNIGKGADHYPATSVIVIYDAENIKRCE